LEKGLPLKYSNYGTAHLQVKRRMEWERCVCAGGWVDARATDGSAGCMEEQSSRQKDDRKDEEKDG